MMPAPDMPGQVEEFSMPVESIMRCEDFKSNFARKLSNRYSTRAPMTKDTVLKLPRSTDDSTNAPERIECTQLSKSIRENDKAAKPPDNTISSDIRHTEVSSLNLEVETLRWQLSQTEANRQMHIALLKQVVSFLSRVKVHIECQKPESGTRKESSNRLAPRSFNAADLPRSRSVVHVNKNLEFSLSPAKKMTARKISKSISNVNGYKDCTGVWSPSKLFPTPEEESTQKISEEMSRLITLANTVLSTKLPDLACTYNDSHEYASIIEMSEIKSQNSDTRTSLNYVNDDICNAFILNTVCDSADTFIGTDSFIEAKNGDLPDFIMPVNSLNNNIPEVKIQKESLNKTSELSVKTQMSVEKRNEYHASFIEDESGFSSMSSFQEIGIPIISVIPPSPCREVGYMDDISDILEDTARWKSNPDLDKQSVKVFWV